MKVSYNWLKDYLDINLPADKVAEILTDTGLEVEGIEHTESIPGGLRGIVIGEVLTCGKHPGADRLSVTTVDVGNGDPLHIVCGAPNVATGQKVVVATVGAMLHPIEGEPFKIKKGKIRGEVSEGMICAEDEIGLGTSHAGIMVLPDYTPVGIPAANYFKVEKDTIFEIGLTPNRSDATSQIGVAKDLAAALRINHGYTGGVKMPDVSAFKVDNNDLPISVQVDDYKACPRYAGLSITGVTVKESPDWLKKRLRAIGVGTKNNIVDITNFVLHELGQPLHAFDAANIKGKQVIVKHLSEGTPFTTLDETERKLRAEDLMICDGESSPMCIAGVFGGIGSGVKDSTTDIFLESAHFNATSIRRSSTKHLLRTDAAKCFEKGSDPNIAVYALKRAALLIQELAGGKVSSDIIDLYPEPVAKAQVKVKYSHINRLIGDSIPKGKVQAILAALEIGILSENGDDLLVEVGTNRADVTREADVIEEILRIYGLNTVPTPSRVRSSISYAQRPDPFTIRNMAGDLLAANGFHEIMGVSITESKYFKDILPYGENELVYINNTANMHLDVMRPSMLFSGLEAIRHNQNRKMSDLRLFEFGRTYRKQGEDYQETEHLTLFMTGQRHPESWLNTSKGAVSFHSIKAFVVNVLERLGISGYQESGANHAALSGGLKLHRGKQTLVEMGRVPSKISKALDIKNPVYYAEFDWDNVMKALKNHKVDFQELNKYPSMRRDLALVIPKTAAFAELVAIAKKSGKKLLTDINLFDVFEDESKVGEGKKSYAISLVFEDPTKTLKVKEVDKVMNNLTRALEQKLGAVVRQ